ncbi:uncharacterized protein LOC122884754 [Siniperca chuatsi]|uniref:uncharacterized protein LOC122884754 n=1 Tax=Siniperca chuatsi TaxID=119488 RepID=UPI001CE1AF23|nr:uncharacterized protein LOC122884754 [Siniperca chuatsi]
MLLCQSLGKLSNSVLLLDLGIHCKIITVTEVSVKAGGSISIPCFYEQQYVNHVKYLCKGYHWSSCSYEVKTNKPDNSGKFSISDDTNQTIFTVTINNLTDVDTYYWCAVEIKYKKDIGRRFQLSVTTGMPSLYVDQQEIIAFEGGSVTVKCRYKYPKVTQWCKLGSTCVRDQTGSIDGTTVTINASVPKVFTVTMSELRTKSSGWHWCANRDLQMPVHLTVHEITSTTTTSTANFTGTRPTTTQHSSLLTSTEPHTAQLTNSTINGAGGEMQDEHKSSTKLTILITTLILQLLVVIAAFFGWRMIRRNRTKSEGPEITVDSQTGSDADVFYGTIFHNQHVAAQRKQNYLPEESVTYSTIVMKDSVPQMEEEETFCSCYYMFRTGSRTFQSTLLCLTLGNMAVHLRILLILTGLTGIHSITIVSQVSVKVGESITIPCLYDSQYKNHVKYLCKGYYWSSCSYAVQTNQPQNPGKFSISDDKNQRIFTVTIKDLTDKDADYWCAVGIIGGADIREYFHLSVTRGTPSLYVDYQEITGFNGENITINCQYSNSGEGKWCRLGSSCVSRPWGSIDGTTVTINTSVHNVFTVTMSGLKTKSSGWYLCVKGDLQMPVHVTVTEQPTTTALATTRCLTTISPTPEPVNPTAVFADKAPNIVQDEQHSASIDLKSLIIPLSVLIFIVMVTLFIWFMLKKHQQNKAASSAMTAAEEDVTYSNTEHMRKTSRQVVANDESVTYSTLACSTSTV